MSNILHNKTERADVLVHMAENVRRLRQRAGLSQQALAEAAHVSRRMLVSIEKGDVNVSLNTLDRLADALGVLFHALIAPPDIGDSARIDERVWAGESADSEARLLASRPARHEVELWSWSMAPGEAYASEADPAGWHNMVLVIEGRLTVCVGGDAFDITAGDFRVFASSQAHGFRNDSAARVRFMRNVVY